MLHTISESPELFIEIHCMLCDKKLLLLYDIYSFISTGQKNSGKNFLPVFRFCCFVLNPTEYLVDKMQKFSLAWSSKWSNIYCTKAARAFQSNTELNIWLKKITLLNSSIVLIDYISEMWFRKRRKSGLCKTAIVGLNRQTNVMGNLTIEDSLIIKVKRFS